MVLNRKSGPLNLKVNQFRLTVALVIYGSVSVVLFSLSLIDVILSKICGAGHGLDPWPG